MFKFCVILHKNYLLFSRRWVQTLSVVLIPILLTLILVLLRNQATRTQIPTTKKWSAFVPDYLPEPPMPETHWWLAYTPNTSHISTIIHNVGHTLNLRSLPFATEEAILTFLHENRSTSSHVLGAVVFNTSDAPGNLSYTIRLRNTIPWMTGMLYPPFAVGTPRAIDSSSASPPGYYYSGFLTLQWELDKAIAHVLCGLSNVNFSMQMNFKRMPFPPYLDDEFIPVIQQELCFVIVLGFMFPVLFAVRSVLVEKYGKMKESLKMLGMSNGVYWCSWSFAYMTLFALLCAVITGILCLPLSSNGAILASSNPLIVFMLCFLYAHSLLTFGFALSTLFDSPHSGTAVSCAVLILIFLPYSLLHEHYNEINQAVKIIAAILPSCAFGFVCRLIGQFEGLGLGAQFSTLFTPANPGDDLSLGLLWIILICESQLFTLFALYVDAVWPGKYGVPRPWHFPITCLCRCKPTASILINDYPEMDDEAQLLQSIAPISDSGIAIDQAVSSTDNGDANCFEPEPIGLPIGIALRKVRKVYKTKQTTVSAVSDLTMNVFHGQITVLLGHNGAGKTTTLSILTGLFPPTSGTAFVGGHDIRTDIDGVRKSLGFCPQHDVYFRELTVEEHLKLVARMKGIRGLALFDQVEKILQQTHLRHKRHACAGTLSGGMRRRLSIGMTLIGDSQVIILDEPTSGLDPEARRQIWTILQEARATRTVLVTTHYMDEADNLGDRIAILAAGKLKCLGSPLFLKSKYGAGHLLAIVKHPDTVSSRLFQHIRRHIPAATIRSDEGSELKVLLPLDSVGQFADLFKELEEYKDMWGVMSFGISVTTMEEVFFRVSEEQVSLAEAGLPPPPQLDFSGYQDPSSITSADADDTQTIRSQSVCTDVQDTRNDGLSLYWQQLVALLSKHGTYLLRHRLLTLSQLLIPIGLSLLAMLIFRHLTRTTQSDEPALPISLGMYGRDLILPYADESMGSSGPQDRFLQAYLSQFNPGEVSGLRMNGTIDFEDTLISQVGKSKMFDYRNRYIVGLVTERQAFPTNMSVRAYFQGELFHTAPITLNAVSNGLLRLLSNRSYSTYCSAAVTPPTISVINHPLPRTGSERIQALNTTEGLIRSLIAGVPLVSNLLLALSYLAASFALALIHEYSTNAKHLQFVSGVKLIPYWLSNYLWDMFLFLIVCGVILCTFAIFNFDAFATRTRLYLVAIIMLFYGWAVLPQMYMLARFFKSPTSGLVWLTVLNHISAIIGLLVVALLSLPTIHKQELAFIISYFWLSWSPTFALADGLFLIFQNYKFRELCDRPEIEWICQSFPTIPCCLGTCTPFCAYWTSNDLGFARTAIGPNLCALAIHGLVFGFLVIFCDCTVARRLRLFIGAVLDRMWYKLFKCGKCIGRPPTYDSRSLESEDFMLEDEDVREHRHRISSMPLGRLKSQTCLVFLNVSKTYGSGHHGARCKPAVDHLTFAILPGECFGLLGVNGAGKTTTFRMLTGDLDPSDGLILVNGFDLNKELHKAQQSIGYCPQFDALLPYLTGRETLLLYARLRGLQEDIAYVEVNRLLADFHLDHYADVLVSHYSGGKRRKLSVAVSLVGGTPLVCLDEPTTGVDPVSRRRMWNILLRCRRQGRTLILSSHSMEECEALCSRVSIVVNGRLKCLGTSQHLKARFGRGYSLTLQVASPSLTDHGDESTSDLLSSETTDSLSTGVLMEAYRMQQRVLDDQIARVNQFVQSHFSGARLVDRHQGVVQYYLPISLVDDLKLSTVFNLIESNKTTLSLINYSVSQTTLENVFIDLAKRQTEPIDQDVERSGCPLLSPTKWRPCCCCHSQTSTSPNLRTRLDSERESLFS